MPANSRNCYLLPNYFFKKIILQVIERAVLASFRLSQLRLAFKFLPPSEKSISSMINDKIRKQTAMMAGIKAIFPVILL
ncbi:MAG: hypothetical protein ABI358_02790 [Ginsengibacter sp.]